MFSFDLSEIVTGCCVFVVIVAAITWSIIISRMKDAKRGLYLAESFLLIAIVLFLAVGTRNTVVDLLDAFRQDKIELSADQNKAVVEAYRQINEEMSRWSVMFVVLGSFFGLVLPIGSYLLQMKEIVRKENEAADRIKEEESRRKEGVAQAKREIDDLRKKFAKDVCKVWRSQAIMAYDRIVAVMDDIKKDKWQFDKTKRWELMSSLMWFLKYLENSKSHDFILRKISDAAKLVRDFNSNMTEADLMQWTNGCVKQSGNAKIALYEYCEDDPKALEEVRDFIHKFGFTVLD